MVWDAGIFALYRLHGILRDEVLLGRLRPVHLELSTHRFYEKTKTYLPDGSAYQGGLFDWEIAAISSPPFPPAGRVLIGGVGGGRELREICKRGYTVTAFEPSPKLAEAAAALASGLPNAAFVRASYRDLVEAARGAPSPLRTALESGQFDAIILGWTSISHLYTLQDRLDLFQALRRIAPQAPVLASFLTTEPPVPACRTERLRRAVRRVSRFLGGSGPTAQGMSYLSGGCFIYRYCPGEFEKLAAAAGYDVVLVRESPYPHAIVVPRPAGNEVSCGCAETGRNQW
jgi:hypothetical protein